MTNPPIVRFVMSYGCVVSASCGRRVGGDVPRSEPVPRVYARALIAADMLHMMAIRSIPAVEPVQGVPVPEPEVKSDRDHVRRTQFVGARGPGGGT